MKLFFIYGLIGNWLRLFLHIDCKDVLSANRKGGALIWRWHFSQRKDRDQEFMVLEREWGQQAEEKFSQQEEQREEKN